MRIILDTTVLVAGMLAHHPQHAWSRPWLSRMGTEDETHATAHTLAELYAVLTAMPPPSRIAPADALRLIRENVLKRARSIVALSAGSYERMIEGLVARGLLGGVVYDAIVLAAAEAIQAEAVVTLNGRDFQRLAAGSAVRVIAP